MEKAIFWQLGMDKLISIAIGFSDFKRYDGEFINFWKTEDSKPQPIFALNVIKYTPENRKIIHILEQNYISLKETTNRVEAETYKLLNKLTR